MCVREIRSRNEKEEGWIGEDSQGRQLFSETYPKVVPPGFRPSYSLLQIFLKFQIDWTGRGGSRL